MSDRDHLPDPGVASTPDLAGSAPAPGKRSLSQRVQRKAAAPPSTPSIAPGPAAPPAAAVDDPFGLHLVQRQAGGVADPDGAVQAAAHAGLAGPATALPFADRIQASFGHHDVGDTRAHIGGAAAAASAAIGATAYATGNDVAFASAPDLHTAAHEAAHVVQQRGGVSLKGGVGEAGDPYERHADRVADLVVAGGSAEAELDALAGGGGNHAAVQRFGSAEHQSLGDRATGGATYDLGGHSAAIDADAYNRAFHLSHGDIVALTGDFFSPRDTRTTATGATERDPDSLFVLAAIPSLNPGQSVGTWDEVVYALKKAIPTDPRFSERCTAEFPEGHPWSRVHFSTAVTEAVDARYLRRAAANDEHFVAPTGADRGPGAGDGASAGGSYRALHEVAIQQAYNTGSASTGNAREAAAQHFLTDHFAAGHVRTPRTSIRTHWQAIYPNFWINIRNKIALDVATWINANDAVGNVASVDMIYTNVQAQVMQQTANIPALGFDDLVSLVTHDFDNEHGVWVTNDIGDHWKLYGDGNLDNPDPENRTREIAQRAIQLGMADIQHAAALGAARGTAPPMASADLFTAVRSQTSEVPPSTTKYGAEQLLPRPDEARAAENGTQNWQQPDLEALWAAPVHSGTTSTYGAELTASMQGGELATELAGMADRFPAEQTTAGIFTVHPQRGFREGFLAPLAANPHAGLQTIINFTPSAGQASHNEDDAVMREVNGGDGAAAASDAELRGMTLQQRTDRCNALLSGWTGEDEGEVVIRLFQTAPASDRPRLYQMIEGHAWSGDFRDGVLVVDDKLVDSLSYPQLARLRTLINGG